MSRRIACVFDIDGILLHGKKPLPFAQALLAQLRKRVPHVLLTNGGGKTEKNKAEELSTLLKIPIPPTHIIQAHTPLTLLPSKKEPYLVVGKNYPQLKDILRGYGFHHLLTCDEIHQNYPEIYPDFVTTNQPFLPRCRSFPYMAGILCMTDPLYWGRELQIVSDFLHHPNLEEFSSESIPFHNCCIDINYMSSYPTPRWGSGSFRMTLEHLYQHQTGHVLTQTLYGKPYSVSFQYAQQQLYHLFPEKEYESIYMIGDNPHTDIQGANNMGHPWKSVLIGTGVFPLQEIDSLFPEQTPHYYFPDLVSFWEWLHPQLNH